MSYSMKNHAHELTNASREINAAIYHPAWDLKRTSDMVAHTSGLIAKAMKRLASSRDSLDSALKWGNEEAVIAWQTNIADDEKWIADLRKILKEEIAATRKAMAVLNTLAAAHALDAVETLALNSTEIK